MFSGVLGIAIHAVFIFLYFAGCLGCLTSNTTQNTHSHDLLTCGHDLLICSLYLANCVHVVLICSLDLVNHCCILIISWKLISKLWPASVHVVGTNFRFDFPARHVWSTVVLWYIYIYTHIHWLFNESCSDWILNQLSVNLISLPCDLVIVLVRDALVIRLLVPDLLLTDGMHGSVWMQSTVTAVIHTLQSTWPSSANV